MFAIHFLLLLAFSLCLVIILVLSKEMERIVLAFMVLCIVLFIGEVCLKEAFADCKSPGGLTWTIKMTPGDGSVTSDSDNLTGKGKANDDDGSEDTVKKTKNNKSSRDDDDDEYERRYFGRNKTNYYNYRKSYWDASGNNPGGFDRSYNLNLSLSDMLSLVGKTITGNRGAYAQQPVYAQPYPLTYSQGYPQGYPQAYPQQYAQQYPPQPQNSSTNYNSGLLGKMYQDQKNTPAANQGAKYVKYLNGLNPDDYVRKDSIPCYACSL